MIKEYFHWQFQLWMSVVWSCRSRVGSEVTNRLLLYLSCFRVRVRCSKDPGLQVAYIKIQETVVTYGFLSLNITGPRRSSIIYIRLASQSFWDVLLFVICCGYIIKRTSSGLWKWRTSQNDWDKRTRFYRDPRVWLSVKKELGQKSENSQFYYYLN